MKIIYKIIAFVSLIAFLSSCDNKLESNDYYMQDRKAYIQFDKKEDNFLIKQDIENKYNVIVKLTGLQKSNVKYTISVDPSSTAVEGIDYDLNQTEFEINSEDLFTSFDVTAYYDTATLEGKHLLLNLTSDDAMLGVKNKIDLNLMKFCPIEADFTGVYMASMVSGGLPGFGNTPIWGNVEVTISVGATETERMFSTPWYPALGAFGDTDVKFSLICGEVIMGENPSGLSCDGGVTPLNVGISTTVNGSYTFDDDTSFNLIFTENVLGGCDETPVITEYNFTKL